MVSPIPSIIYWLLRLPFPRLAVCPSLRAHFLFVVTSSDRSRTSRLSAPLLPPCLARTPTARDVPPNNYYNSSLSSPLPCNAICIPAERLLCKHRWVLHKGRPAGTKITSPDRRDEGEKGMRGDMCRAGVAWSRRGGRSGAETWTGIGDPLPPVTKNYKQAGRKKNVPRGREAGGADSDWRRVKACTVLFMDAPESTFLRDQTSCGHKNPLSTKRASC